ncbi:MAG TPA: 50S ribosomal protein L2 [Candidatus Nanoarchaeia archaeon]|nr:50S ribosomal protein L2 [Candidatus Nanoarchaeia archaeon]
MGKNLIQQRRGKGSSTFRARSFNAEGPAKHISYSKDSHSGKVVDIIHSYMHSGPLMQIKYDNQEAVLIQAPEGVHVGKDVVSGPKAPIEIGNSLPLKDIPEGTDIYNIESMPGDGGKFVRSAGSSARITSKFPDKITVMLPSKKERSFSPECRASIGIIAGSGRLEKPFLKAGNKFHRMKARNKYYPQVQGVSMNAVAHPFGSKSSRTKGRPTQASRNAPPGRKVGKIAPRRTGHRR